MTQLLEWLTLLPQWALYFSLSLVAGIENIFPPFPADTVVAFGAFLAARGHGTALGAFLATWSGNIAGAMIMYAAGRKYGAGWLHARLAKSGEDRFERRMRQMYGKYGLAALFLSRFLPGVRAVVPPFAGALRIPAGRACVIMSLASGVWYGLVTYLAFRVGANWDELSQRISFWQKGIGLVAVSLTVIALVAWLVWRRRARR